MMTSSLMASQALIGHSGFVGSTLKRQHQFSHFYRSSDIDTIKGKDFDLVICAAAPAQKWIANQKPGEDWACIERLIQNLSSIKAARFVLISTVDVFKEPVLVDETTEVDTANLHPYGLHRRRLEQFVEQSFPAHLVIRLPGLVGPGLKKNVIYDFHNNHDLHKIDGRSLFQFYPMINLWSDIQTALELRHLRLLHLTAAPVSVAQISSQAFGRPFELECMQNPPAYDFQSIYASSFGGAGRYQYSQRETIQAVRAYVQTEPLTKDLKS